MNKRYLLFASVILGAVFLFTKCTDEETENLKAGTLNLKITDTASDDEYIKGIFITIAGIQLDGKPIRNFNPETIEISELKNGATQLLISKELPAKSYNQISLVLASGSNNSENKSGCYVLSVDGNKHDLFPGSTVPPETELTISKPFELLPTSEINLVIDFDLRKAMVHNSSETNKYRFVTHQELENSIRLVDEERTGTITGTVKANDLENNHIYVYVYRHGEFKMSVEGTGNGKSNILFANAVTSAKVEPDGSYSIPFVEEGEYDIRLGSYKRNRDGIFTFNGFARTSSRRTGLLLNNVAVAAGSETKLDIEVFELL